MGYDVRQIDILFAVQHAAKQLTADAEKLCEASDELLSEMEIDTSDFTLSARCESAKTSVSVIKNLLAELEELQG